MATETPLSPIVITLHGRDRPIRFSISAFEEFEQTTGQSIVQAFQNPRLMKITDLVTALHIGVKHGGGVQANYTRDKIRDWLDQGLDTGAIDLVHVVNQVIAAVRRSSAFKGLPENRGEDDEEGESASPSASVDGAPAPNWPSTN